MRYYDTLAEYDRDGFNIVVDKTWEDMDVGDCFDDGIDPDTGKPYYDLDQMREDINSGQLDWFMLRVRVFVDDLELATDYVGGFLYEDAREVLTDGTAEDMIHTALESAKDRVYTLYQRFWALSMEIDSARANSPMV
jgi:hypothetical protein